MLTLKQKVKKSKIVLIVAYKKLFHIKELYRWFWRLDTTREQDKDFFLIDPTKVLRLVSLLKRKMN